MAVSFLSRTPQCWNGRCLYAYTNEPGDDAGTACCPSRTVNPLNNQTVRCVPASRLRHVGVLVMKIIACYCYFIGTGERANTDKLALDRPCPARFHSTVDPVAPPRRLIRRRRPRRQP